MTNDSAIIAGGPFQTIDLLDGSPVDLGELCGMVARCAGRIRLLRGDGEACVLISKKELDALEEALEILSRMPDGAAIRAMVMRLAQRVSAPVAV